MIRVLITCVGSGVGQSVVDSLKYSKGDYFLVASDQNRYCYPMPDCDAYISLPDICDQDYVDELLKVCKSMGVDVVVPGHDQELSLFAGSLLKFERAGVSVIIAKEPLVCLLRDKLAWSQKFRARTSAVVPSCSVAEFRRGGLGAADIYFPAIAKPAGGSASTGLTIIHNPDDLAGVPDDDVIQPFLFPSDDDSELATIREAVSAKRVVQISEISVQLVYAADGELMGRFASRNRLKSGVPIEVLPIDSSVVWDAVEEIETALADYEPRGPINLQGRITDRGLVFFEMNPRFTGITGNRAQFGFNEVALLVDNFVTGAKRKLFVNANKVGVRQVACRAWPRERYRFGELREEGTLTQTVLLLGGTSWFGRHVARARAELGDTVIVICRKQSVESAAALHSDLENVRVISDESRTLKDAFGFADVIVNFVSGRPPHGTRAIADAHRYQMYMLDLAEIGEVPKIINISSQSVYPLSDSCEPQREDTVLNVTEPYAFSKFSIEETIRSLARRRPSVTAASLRLARLFGAAEGLRTNEFPHRVVSNAIGDIEIELCGAQSVLDLLDLRDAVSAVNFFVDYRNGTWCGDVFNVGSGSPVTIGRYVSLANRICRQRLNRAVQIIEREQSGGNRAGLECSKLRQMGWTASYPLERSIDDLFEYFMNGR